MVAMRVYLLVAALCACCGLGSSGLTTPPPPVLINLTPKAEAPVENVETTTNKVETTTTPAPTTTSTTPPTTTSSTTPPTTTSSTTTPAPTPAPAPTPLPPPEQQTWSYSANNVTCIVVQFAAQLNITYTKTTVDNDTVLASRLLNVPTNATVVGGSCDPAEQVLTLSWPAGASSISNTMTLTYAKNATTKTYGLKSLELELSPDLFVNASFKSVVSLRHGAAWPTPLGTSYRCTPATRLNMTGDSVSGAVAAVTFTKLQEEAFRTVNGTGFSAARECGGDVPDAVPIAVGCALGGLVLVVLVAYLVGRRRSNARGYLSM